MMMKIPLPACSALTAGLILMMTTTASSAAVPLEWRARASLNDGVLAVADGMDRGRHHPITFANETHAFLLGGWSYTAVAANDFYMYDPMDDIWTEQDVSNLTVGTNYPPARSFAYGVVLNEINHPKAYLGFGMDENGIPLNDWWEFDMMTLIFRPLASCPGVGRNHPSMVPVYLNGQWSIHVGLGDSFDDAGEFINLGDYWRYDINTDTWEALPDFPESKRHHPYYFGLNGVSYVGLGHSGADPFIERDFYSYHTTTNTWRREPDFASYVESPPAVLAAGAATTSLAAATSEARVAGTQFSIEFPLVGTTTVPFTNATTRALGFVLSGDGDDHESMETGEFHAFYPASGDSSSTDGSATTSAAAAWWRQLTPHPGRARWAPGSFVLRGTTTAYFCCGYDRVTTILHADMWSIDLSALFTTELPTSTTTFNDLGNNDVDQNGTAPTTTVSSPTIGGGGNGSSNGNNNTSSPGPEGATTTTTNGAFAPAADTSAGRMMSFYAAVVMVFGMVLSSCT
jgi:hypothetical protein